ncbi:unnamed protein product [Medioppia subpectinata]|uniref:Alpha-mannosidase n=1 Tax=Medioppia subpectinata TaxID=1979941 RepID=A0A7R9PXK6_9ACAR|nr:unnamed protein product [Medioppia subpectinata]CAG2104129.1 unnamed protein product [Medioppia subpectinata]
MFRECGYKSCEKTDAKKLNIHIISHSHDDVGWLKTVDGYYTEDVSHILTNVVNSLDKNPKRKFTEVETYYFNRWWSEQNNETRDLVHKLVSSGQLGFANGGYTVNDEGSAHYNEIIDQMTLGEFIWGGSADLGQSANIFTTILHNHYSAPDSMATSSIEVLSRKESSFGAEVLTWDRALTFSPQSFTTITALPRGNDINDKNKKQKADTIVSLAKQWNKDFGDTNHVLMTFGDDFKYNNAEHYFANLDKLANAVNEFHPDVHMFYSNPMCYLWSVNQLNRTFEYRERDYFPLWSGFFTSRPSLKRQERSTNNLLQISKQLDSMTRIPESEPFLNEAMNEVSVLTHHDAITGTSPQKTIDDYILRLFSASDALQEVTNRMYRKLIPKQELDISLPKQIICDRLNISECHVSETSNEFTLVVYNPIGRPVSQWLRIPIPSNNKPIDANNPKEENTKSNGELKGKGFTLSLDQKTGNIEKVKMVNGNEFPLKQSFKFYKSNHDSSYDFCSEGQAVKRIRNSHQKDCGKFKESISDNYYPIYERILLKDSAKGMQLTVLTDRAQGGSSEMDGQIELMVHRRLLTDTRTSLNETGVDGKGLVVSGKHFIFFKPINESSKLFRDLDQRLFMSPLITFSPLTQTQAEYRNKYKTSYSALNQELPQNVHLLTLEKWTQNELLLRLEHFYQKEDNNELSKDVEIDLKNMFKDIKIKDVREMTLSANQELSESQKSRLQWKSKNPLNNIQFNSNQHFNDISKVKLSSQQIRTFILTIEDNTKKVNCSLEWIKITGTKIPKNAIVGGFDIDTKPLYICRHKRDDDLLPGKANENIGCVVTMGGKAFSTKSDYEVLIGHNYDWVERHGGDAVPDRAFIGGHDLNSNPIYVGKCDLHFGKTETQVVGKIHHKFYYGFGDTERSDCANHMVMSQLNASQELQEMDNESTSVETMDGERDGKRRRLFGKELRCMMYGFGDDHNPFTEAVDMLEDLVIQFIQDISLKAQDVGKNGKISVEDVLHCVKRDERKYCRVRDLFPDQDVGKNGKISVEDVLHCVKRDERKYCRVRDLLSMNEELKKARKAFDEIKYVSNA